jgi:hypothetical protein
MSIGADMSRLAHSPIASFSAHHSNDSESTYIQQLDYFLQVPIAIGKRKIFVA